MIEAIGTDVIRTNIMPITTSVSQSLNILCIIFKIKSYWLKEAHSLHVQNAFSSLKKVHRWTGRITLSRLPNRQHLIVPYRRHYILVHLCIYNTLLDGSGIEHMHLTDGP